MGTTLTGLTPATTYDALIKVTDNGPLSATAKRLSDGLGNDSVVALSTTAVGIGTTGPTQLLHVDGNVRITGALYDGNNAAGTSGQILSSTGTATDWVSKSDLSLVDGSGTANYVSKWSDTDTLTNSLIYDNGTNVGIGTSTFTNFVDRLRVVGDTNGVDLGGSSSTGVIRIRGAASTGASLIDFTDLSTDPNSSPFYQGRLFYSFSDNSLAVHTNSAERLRITAAGNVGIGTNSPSRPLTVVSTQWDNSTGAGAIFSNSNSVGAGITLQPSASVVANGPNGWALYAGGPSAAIGDGNLGFWAHGTNEARMVIQRGGNVGIGTSAPSTRLQVVGGGQTTSIANAATTSTSRFDVANPSISLGIGYVGTDIPMLQSFNNGTNGATNLTINPFGGSVGIGTTSPAYKLEVNGNAYCTDLSLPAAGGIYFDSGASKYLDDYEEGTWTPTLTGSGTNPTYTATALGNYTKIGRQVTAQIDISISTYGAGSGSIRISLPFTVNGSMGYFQAACYVYGVDINGLYLTAEPNAGNSFATINQIQDDAAASGLPQSAIAAGDIIRTTVTYFV